jgi:hypothetical protein
MIVREFRHRNRLAIWTVTAFTAIGLLALAHDDLAAGDEASFTSAVPSARQNTSMSSFSIRLHVGQCFIETFKRIHCGNPIRRLRSAYRGSL